MELADFRAWGNRFNRGMTIRRQVMQILGISLPKRIGTEVREAVRQSMIGCTTCDQLRSCSSWVSFGNGSDGPPVFCPNRAVFLRLMKETS